MPSRATRHLKPTTEKKMAGEIAKTILQQIDGNRLKLFVGAYNFVDHGDGLSFRFKGSKKANYVKVTLNASDLYDLEFIKVGNITLKMAGLSQEDFDRKLFKNKAEFSGVYFDQLISFFEDHTELFLSL